MSFTWPLNPNLPNPRWFVPVVIFLALLIFVCMARADTLGQQNNNPINLKAFDTWQGMLGKDKFGHAVFENLEMGIRAGLINLKTHQKQHPGQTLVHYLMTFAEANGCYEAGYVADKLNISIETKLKDIDTVDLLIHLAWFESRVKLSRAEVIKIKEKYKI